jgi:hypothetical protein
MGSTGTYYPDEAINSTNNNRAASFIIKMALQFM